MAHIASADLYDMPVIEHVSPVTGQKIRVEQAATVAECRQFAGQAAAAFPAWSTLPPLQRAERLLAVADCIGDSADEFRIVMAEELGTPPEWALHNVDFVMEILRGVASYHAWLDKPEQLPDSRGFASRAERVPAGVCLGIAPWNAPLILGVRAIAAPLLCGNTVLLKGSEFAPRTFRLLGEMLKRGGIEEDIARVLLTRPENSEEIVETLIASPVIRRVNFTGSTRIGRRIAELCARHLKPSLLELGGQATMIVLEDADLDAAAEAILWGAYVNQGQVCMSTERLVVAEPVADALIGKLEAGRRLLKPGNPLEEETRIGPVISAAAAERLSGLIGDAIGKGATLVGGGKAQAAFFEPALVDHVDSDMRLYREEIFGPILAVTRIDSDLEAITVANDSEYGLSSAVFSSDEARAQEVARALHTGICHINSPTIDDNPHAPFGGVKHSGYGRFGGHWALEEFTELRWITSASSNQQDDLE